MFALTTVKTACAYKGRDYLFVAIIFAAAIYDCIVTVFTFDF